MPRRASCRIAMAVALAGLAAPAVADPLPYAGRLMSDTALDQMRGGFELPNGMDVSIGIQIDTLVNGLTVLRTLLTSGNGSALQVFSGGPAMSAGASGGGKGLSVQLVSSVSSNGSATGAQPLALAPNGAAIETDAGAVRLVQSNGQSTVMLDGNGLMLQQMVGALTGALVTNQASDRTIDTNITVNVAVPNSAIPVGSMLMRLDSVLLGAGARGAM